MDIVSGHYPIHRKPPGRRERKKRDTRLRIFRAAFELFTEKGFEATTVEEIAERADVGKGTVFNHFPQKTAFLVAAYREWVGVIREELGPIESWEGPARAQLGRVFSYLTELAVERRALALQVVFENMRQTQLRMTGEKRDDDGSGPGEAIGTGEPPDDPAAVRLLEEMTWEVIRRGKDNGEIRAEADGDQAASLIAAAGFHTLVRGLVRGETAGEIHTSLAAKLDIIFTGLAP